MRDPQTEAVRREYDRLAAEYDHRWRFYIDATLQATLDAVHLRGNEAVLDVPCGTGELALRLLANWPDLTLTGVDVSREMLHQARRKDAERKIAWREADVLELPLPDESFDWVVCANSFHYFPAPERALAELRRVLRPGGRLVLVDWCDDYLTCKLCSVWLRWTDAAFHRTWSLAACRELAENAGLELERAERFRINWLWGLMRLIGRRT